MSTHTAVATTSLGKIDAIQIPTRIPGDGDILIKTSAVAISLFDTYPVDRAFLVNAYPYILGFNGAGTVVEVGTGVHDFKVGDRVSHPVDIRFKFLLSPKGSCPNNGSSSGQIFARVHYRISNPLHQGMYLEHCVTNNLIVQHTLNRSQTPSHSQKQLQSQTTL